MSTQTLNDPKPISRTGKVVSVRGSIVEVKFEPGQGLPAVNSLLSAGFDRLEVWAQVDSQRVRGIAMTPTQGLARGATVVDTGGPLMAPVGKGILGRMFDVLVTP